MNYTSDRPMIDLFMRKDGERPTSLPVLRLAVLAAALTSAGCGRLVDELPSGPETLVPPDVLPIDPDAPYPPAVAAAIGRLADELGVAPQSIEVVSYEEVEWPDGCLGLPRLYEACTEAVTPGWRVVLSLAGEIHAFRADLAGAELREE